MFSIVNHDMNLSFEGTVIGFKVNTLHVYFIFLRNNFGKSIHQTDLVDSNNSYGS